MIKLAPTTAFMLYLAITLSFLLGLWVWQHYKLKHKKILPSEKVLRECEFCLFTYLDIETKKISRCPRCLSYNKYTDTQKNKHSL